ncbi:hypothetical protein OAL97_03375, partial [Paracoccaceae bacterium]|nr:hypothetical protein [Paracoccaceae bacterium]
RATKAAYRRRQTAVAHRRLTAIEVFLAAIAAAGTAVGQPIELSFPLDCVLGQTCYIEDYIDLGPGDGHTDYR